MPHLPAIMCLMWSKSKPRLRRLSKRIALRMIVRSDERHTGEIITADNGRYHNHSGPWANKSLVVTSREHISPGITLTRL